ncbi:C-type lectin domain family 4 member G isoform X3 [Ursus maritimus]|uniref:C-type lectin domain family 4 member G isoform X3 n=1 Tax=Ursus maritimus TaxID=29073 RepID=A0A384DCX0_URSMA|nr:C-type lectin domain family 4 member G isoform X3 [Ursus maritimus]
MAEARQSSNPNEITALRAKLPPQQGNTVLKRTQQVQKEVFQLNEKVTQGLGDAGHDRDFIRGEVFQQIKAVLAGNESSCEPCPLDWKVFQGSCYFFSLDNLTWTQANDSCVQKKGHLVIINCRTEQDFLTSTVQVTSWIGLFKEGQKGHHRWMDASTPTYINWDSEELHDNVTVPACMVMHSYGHWSDFSCELGRFAFICERRQNC